MSAWRNTNEYEWHSGHSTPLSCNIVQRTLVVSRTGRHFRLHPFHGKDLNPDIDFIAHVERKVLHEQVVSNEAVLPKLDRLPRIVFSRLTFVLSWSASMFVIAASTSFQI